ncbi:beta-defensin 43-like [Castor canadensis]|uniref:Beta-defensin 43-like n=1 Tax=Castor canadensis TaxID=51338 RepID=A0AC58KWZ8_CASCN
MSPLPQLPPLAPNLLLRHSTDQTARSFAFKTGCSSDYQSCRMKCKVDEHALRYCDDWSICCGVKNSEVKKMKKW